MGMTDCDYVVKGNTEDEILQNGFAHASKEHGMKAEDMTPEMRAKAISLIRRS
jgi:predicted small metal-binding protein